MNGNSSTNASCFQYGGCPQPPPPDSHLPYTGYAAGFVLIVSTLMLVFGAKLRRWTR